MDQAEGGLVRDDSWTCPGMPTEVIVSIGIVTVMGKAVSEPFHSAGASPIEILPGGAANGRMSLPCPSLTAEIATS